MQRRLVRFSEWLETKIDSASDSWLALLRADWNQPGRYVKGILYKATTVNLVFLAVGTLLALIVVVNGNAQVTARGGTLECGTVFSPRETFESEGLQLAEALGYTYNGSGSGISQKIDCKNALSESSGPVYNYGMPAAVFLVGAGLIAFCRDPNEGYWAPLEKGSKPTTPSRGASAQRHSSQPGWYPDQSDPTLLRWFNGNDWTSATLPNVAGNSAIPENQSADTDKDG